jgi:hypothetical protein
LSSGLIDQLQSWLQDQLIQRLIGAVSDFLIPGKKILTTIYDGVSFLADNVDSITEFLNNFFAGLNKILLEGDSSGAAAFELLKGLADKAIDMGVALFASLSGVSLDRVATRVKCVLLYLRDKLKQLTIKVVKNLVGKFKDDPKQPSKPYCKVPKLSDKPAEPMACGKSCFRAGSLTRWNNGQERPIEQHQCGQRMETLEEQEHSRWAFPYYAKATWIREETRLLRVRQDRGLGDWSEIELLRPATWLAEQGAEVGGTIRLDLPEMSITGQVRVQAINACPPLEQGSGRLVTGVFRHSRGTVYNLQVEGEKLPIGVTGTHPFWSVDREAWIQVKDLRIGERLQGLDGKTPRVVSLTLQAEPEPVFNIEVEGDHCYRVGEQGFLVYNTSAPPNPCPSTTQYTLRSTTAIVYAGKQVQRATGVDAVIVADTNARTDFNDPPWWMDFRTNNPLTGSSWEKGHLLRSRFGGPGGSSFENLAPQTFRVNRSIFPQCDARIQAALACGCVRYAITVNYPASGDQLRPTSFTITATDMQGNDFLNGVTIDNVVTPQTPSQCQRPQS